MRRKHLLFLLIFSMAAGAFLWGSCKTEPEPQTATTSDASAIDATQYKAGIFPFGPMTRSYGSPTVWGNLCNGQSLMVGGGGGGVLSRLAVPAGTTLGANIKLLDSKAGASGGFWNPLTAYAQGYTIYPSDPLDAGMFVNDGGNCTSVNGLEPNWNRAIGSAVVDGTCYWVTKQGGDASIPWDPNLSDSASLSIGSLTIPSRVENSVGTATGNGKGFSYPNQLLGELLCTDLSMQESLLQGGVWASTTVAIGGAAYADIAKNGTQNSYAASLFEAQAFTRLVPASYPGSVYKVAGVPLLNGEADEQTTSPSTWSSNLIAYQAALQTDIQAITGQTEVPYLYVSPQSSNTGGTMLFNSSGTMQGALDACNVFGSKVICFGAKQSYEYVVDLIHLQSGAYRRHAEKLAQIQSIVMSGATWSPTQPTQITCTSGTCTLSYHVPYGCLQFDSVLPLYHQSGAFSSWSPCHGFEIFKAAGTIQSCTSATISSCNQVTLIAGTSDVGYIGYGSIADVAGTDGAAPPTTPPCSNCSIRGGQLTDQDTFVGMDVENLTCTTTNGSNRISCTNTQGIDERRTYFDYVTGTGIPAGAVITGRAGGSGTVDLSANATASGTVSLNFRHRQLNDGMPFQVQVGSASSVACADIEAAASGQTSRCSGSGFIGSTTAGAAIPHVFVNGSEVSVTYLSSAVLEISGLPTLAAGSYTVIVQNPYDAQVSFSNAITAKTNGASTDSMSSIWNNWVRWRSTGDAVVGSPATSLPDLSGSGISASKVGGSGLTVTANDAVCGGSHTSVTFNGSDDLLKASSVSIASATGNPVLMILAIKLLGSTGSKIPFGLQASVLDEFQYTGSNALFLQSGASATWSGTSPLNNSKAWYGWAPGGSGTQTIGVAINNGTQVTSSGAITAVHTTADLGIGGRSDNGATKSNFTFCEGAIIAPPPGTTYASMSTKLSRTEAMFNSKFGATY